MAFNLDGVISKEEIRNLFIPSVSKALVSKEFVDVETVLDAESLKIPGVADVTVADYTGTAVTTDAGDTSVILTLDQAKYFQKAIDKVDNAQSAIKIIGKVLERGAVATAEAIDEFIFSVLAGTPNTVTGTALDETNIVEFFSALSVKLTNLKAPKAGRKAAVTPEIGALLVDAGMKLESDALASEAARTGWIGRFYGFDVYESLSLADGTSGKMVVATAPSGAVAGIGYQEYDVTEPSTGFKWIAKGLANYGGQIVQPAYVVASDATVA